MGDESAFKELFDQYFVPLRWYACKILNSEFWAEEVVQEIFVQLWVKKEQLPDIITPTHYLQRMIRNRCFDKIRRQQLEVEMQYIVSRILHPAQENSSPEPGAYTVDKLEALILQAIQTLPEQRKKIYLMQQTEGFSYQEIADHLGISRNTVRNQMAKALQSIRQYLLERDVLQAVLYSFWYLW